jgi:hypothetical protein
MSNEEQIKDDEEYDSMTDEAKELYDILEEHYPDFKHNDIMDCVMGYAGMKVFKNDEEEK